MHYCGCFEVVFVLFLQHRTLFGVEKQWFFAKKLYPQFSLFFGVFPSLAAILLLWGMLEMFGAQNGRKCSANGNFTVCDTSKRSVIGKNKSWAAGKIKKYGRNCCDGWERRRRRQHLFGCWSASSVSWKIGGTKRHFWHSLASFRCSMMVLKYSRDQFKAKNAIECLLTRFTRLLERSTHGSPKISCFSRMSFAPGVHMTHTPFRLSNWCSIA